MNALTAPVTVSPTPTSYQVKLAFCHRKYRFASACSGFPLLHRRNGSFVVVRVRCSASNDNETGRKATDNSSWVNLNSSGDGFSGWGNAGIGRRSNDSNSKQSLLGCAGVVIFAGLTVAVLTFSKRGTMRVMAPLTTEQENSLPSSDNQCEIEDESDDKVASLGSESEENESGTDNVPCFPRENALYSENRNKDDADVRQSVENGTDSVIDSYQSKSVQSLVSSDIGDELPKTDACYDSVAPADVEISSNGVPSESSDEIAVTSNLENPDSDYPSGFSNSKEDQELSFSSSPYDVEHPVEGIEVKDESEFLEFSHTKVDSVDLGRIPLMSDVEQSQEFSILMIHPTDTTNVSADEDAKSSLEENISEKVQELSSQSNDQSLENDSRSNPSFFDPTSLGKILLSTGIPAPSVAALPAHPGKVLIPAAVDQLQSQALSALQVLKVIEDDVKPGDLCTRREYARWLVLANSVLSRSTSSKVYPAMYIENASELAFDDITPEDSDFTSIQGLAEAGLIASKLSRHDLQSDKEDTSPFYFYPDSPLSRQDLVSWKMALEKRQLPLVDKKTLQQLSGFIDLDRIDKDAWPALVADLAAEEQGIVTLAFGYTRLFQPEKPVTKAQAAIALATGEACAIVSEELARIEAETMAESAVTAHNALVAQVGNELNESYEKALQLERERTVAVEQLAEEARREVEKLRAAREEETLSMMKERASVDSEMEFLSRLRRDAEGQLQAVMADKLEISYEKERLNKLRREAEGENQEITRLQYELEVERKALSIARAWAEDEAKRAREQAKALDEARCRWERQGIKVVVDKELSDEAEPAVTWLVTGEQFSEEINERSEGLVSRLRALRREVGGRMRDTISRIIETILLFISNLKKKVAELNQAAKSRWEDSLQHLQEDSNAFTSAVKESARHISGDWKERVEKISQRFKT